MDKVNGWKNLYLSLYLSMKLSKWILNLINGRTGMSYKP